MKEEDEITFLLATRTLFLIIFTGRRCDLSGHWYRLIVFHFQNRSLQFLSLSQGDLGIVFMATMPLIHG